MKALNLTFNVVSSSERDELKADGWIYLLPIAVDKSEQTLKSSAKKKQDLSNLLTPATKPHFETIAKKRAFILKPGSSLSFDDSQLIRRTLLGFATDDGMFSWLTQARQVLDNAVFHGKVKHLVVDLTAGGSHAADLSDAFMSALAAAVYKFPKYQDKKTDRDNTDKNKNESDALKVTFLTERNQTKTVEAKAHEALTITAEGTNLVRWLGKRAGNDLTCKTYMSYLKDLASKRRWKFEVFDHKKLTALKAGAFLAVVKGSDHQDYGIAKLSYKPSGAKKHLVLVGKGLVFDTGGYNIKTSHMFGMHGDMTGSAVALAILNVATQLKLPVQITAYLAIADNMVGPKSYKPNDVITTMNGTTIEVIDTDAEGRMVLSDTLTLAAKEDADLMMDFATLTVTCIRAIGTTFSGVFSNRSSLGPDLISSGYKSGERVWPFPMDKDFAECLESTSADTKQCREKGGVDHIEASQFLMRFAGKKTPWVHVDLSAAENDGGLAHIPTTETGFGVRFALDFARTQLKI